MNAPRLLFAALLLAAAHAHAQVNLWGTVVLESSREPAASVDLRLKLNGREVARVLTNNAGRYGLHNLSVPTSKYQLQIYRNGLPVRGAEMRLPALANGARVPDIVMPRR